MRKKLLTGFSPPPVKNAEHLSLNKLINRHGAYSITCQSLWNCCSTLQWFCLHFWCQIGKCCSEEQQVSRQRALWLPNHWVSLGFVAMRINQNTVLQGKKVTLVPYTLAHVPRYHEWMKSEELQHLTASEPLSLEQEYEMQCSWREDTDKCTFIILDTEKWSRQSAAEEDCMVGDVNLFLTDTEDPTQGEIEVMIAEASYRGRGFGKEATQIMMSYGMTRLGLTTFEAKIGLENEASISMFKKLHFKEVGVNSVFQEVTLRLSADEQEREWLLEQTSHVEEKNYSVMKMQNRACSS